MREDLQVYQELQQAPFFRLLLTARVSAQVSVLRKQCQLYNLGSSKQPVSNAKTKTIK